MQRMNRFFNFGKIMALWILLTLAKKQAFRNTLTKRTK